MLFLPSLTVKKTILNLFRSPWCPWAAVLGGQSPPQSSSLSLAGTWRSGQGMHVLTGETTNCKRHGRTRAFLRNLFLHNDLMGCHECGIVHRDCLLHVFKSFAFVFFCFGVFTPPPKKFLSHPQHILWPKIPGVHKGVVFKVSARRYK